MYYNTSIYIDPKTKDYKNLNGQIENQNAVLTEIYMRLMIPKDKYIYGNKKVGSLIYTIANKRGIINKTKVEEYVADALKPMVIAGKITIQDIRIPKLILNNVKIEIDCTDVSGEPIYFVLDAII
jgi:phage gp46-like protein